MNLAMQAIYTKITAQGAMQQIFTYFTFTYFRYLKSHGSEVSYLCFATYFIHQTIALGRLVIESE